MSQQLPRIPEGVPFSFFVSLLHEISRAPPRKPSSLPDRTSSTYPALQILRRWIAELHKQFASLPYGTVAITFRLLFPEEDTRRKYDMQETRLAQYLAECFGIRDQRLQNWGKDDSSGCLGEEVKRILNGVCANIEGHISPLSIADVDTLLDELASHSGFSHVSIRNQYTPNTRHHKCTIFRALYRSLSPIDASFLTQIILKDLRPLLYPLSQTHYTTALKQFNSASVKMLTKEHAMLAWDPSRWMLEMYRVRSNLHDAAAEFEGGGSHANVVTPKVGTPIEIPKSEKGRGCNHALHFFRNSHEVWAETKYDGERAQIHVEVLADNSSRITIFSKSKRDSTQDRIAIHGIIRGALGLPDCERWPGGKSKVKKNVVVDAEMVAYHGNHIDEFWRIRSLVERTAHGVRSARKDTITCPSGSQSALCSQSSLITDSSGTRNLALVFFDILILNSTSLLSTPYCDRRSLLESLIIPIPGQAMLADRTAIELNGDKGNDMEQAEMDLRKFFAQIIADHQEGLVLKASDGVYNDFRIPWVKLKKDYIPGYGDSLDLVVLCAGWDKARARELRVAPTTFTTLYVGVLENAEAMKATPTLRPHFHVYFTVSYGMSRDQLEETNFLIKSSDPLPYHKSNAPTDGLSYTFTMFSGLQPPTVILRDPWLAELYGAGFTKAPKSKHYELRFPRITKIFRIGERHWKESVNLQDLQKIARSAVGRDRLNKDIDDWCNDLWGKPVSPGVKCSRKRKATADAWEDKLAALDRKVSRQKGMKIKAAALERRKAQKADNSFDVWQPVVALQPLGTRTNVELSPTFIHSSLQVHESPDGISLRVVKSPLATHATPSMLGNANLRTRYPSPIISQDKASIDCENETSSSSISGSEVMVLHERSGNQTFSGDPGVTPMAKFLRNALVWFARSRGGSRPCCLPWKKLVHQEHQLHSMESLLMGCGWHQDTKIVCNWVERGIVFVDDSEDGGKEWKRYALEMLRERGATVANAGMGKPIWIFNTWTLGFDVDDIESKALFRLG